MLLGVSSSLSVAQETNGNPAKKAAQANAELAPSEYNPAPVDIDERPIFLVYGAVGGLSPEERASNIKARILDFARQSDIPVSFVHIEDRGPWLEIQAGDKPIMGVSEYDARIAGRPRNELAYEYAEVIRRTVTLYRQVHTWGNLVRAWIYTLVASSGLFLFLGCWFDSAVCCGPGLSVGQRPQITGYAENHTLSFLALFGAILNSNRQDAFLGLLGRRTQRLCHARFKLLSSHAVYLGKNRAMDILATGCLGERGRRISSQSICRIGNLRDRVLLDPTKMAISSARYKKGD